MFKIYLAVVVLYLLGNFAAVFATGWNSSVQSESECHLDAGYSQDVVDIWRKYSSFSMEDAGSVSPECSESLKRIAKNRRRNNLDALKMFDATGKLPSGILRGNVNQFGDFDECLSVPEARYCLAEIDIGNLWTPPFDRYEKLIHSHRAIKEKFSDPKHRVPGFTLIRWGFCVPKQCTPTDVENSLRELIGAEANVKPTMCQPSKIEPELSYGKIFACCFFFTLGVLSLFGTSGLTRNDDKISRMIRCFDLRKNWESLTKFPDKDVGAIHGIRALGALGLIMSHKTMALFYNPYMNRSQMTENLGLPWSVIGRTAILFTDCFMLISGFLNANSMLDELSTGRPVHFGRKLLTRIFRITPNLLAVILFCTYFLPSLGSGPLWPMVIDHHSHLCKHHMWRNMLFIHNYFPFEDMCLTHTHQVGIDMQLFVFTPLVVILLWRNKKVGLYFTGFLALASTVLRLWATLKYSLSHVVHFGITVSRMFDTANYSYIMPTHRATIYLMGVYLAYHMKTKPTPLLSKTKSAILNSIFFAVGLVTWLGPMNMSVESYEYNKMDAGVYGTLSPITWGAAVAWAIYSTENGFGGIYDILRWEKFKYFTKISYAVYLVQFPVFFYNVGLTKHVDEFKSHYILQIPETLAIILISIGLTLLVEIPFVNLKRVIFDGYGVKSADLDEKKVIDGVNEVRKSKLF